MGTLSGLLDNDVVTGLLALAIGIAVMLAAYSALGVANTLSDPLRRRLLDLIGQPAGPDLQAPRWVRLIGPLAPYLLPNRSGERDSLRRKLRRAGFASEAAAINLYIAKVLLAVLAPVAVVGALLLYSEVHGVYVAFFGFLTASAGLLLPNFVLNRRIEARQTEMMNALPDALDLLVSCTEAGLGLNGALQRVARQMHLSSRLLAQELEELNAEIRSGVDRITALKSFSERTGLDEVRGLVSLLSQSLRFGSPVAEILRVYAEEFRDKRAQRAEEQAALVGTKLIFPLVFCIFPSFFIVAIGPAVLGVIRALSTVHFGK